MVARPCATKNEVKAGDAAPSSLAKVPGGEMIFLNHVIAAASWGSTQAARLSNIWLQVFLLKSIVVPPE
jgi:hypothetical protein